MLFMAGTYFPVACKFPEPGSVDPRPNRSYIRGQQFVLGISSTTTTAEKMSIAHVSRCLLLLAVICYCSAFRSHGRSGSYSLPNIGNFPAPTPFNPGRNMGLPPAYHGRFKRSFDGQLDEELQGDGGVLALEHEPEFVREARSADELEAAGLYSELSHPESLRERRSTGFKIIRPTYRPPRTSRPKIYYA